MKNNADEIRRLKERLGQGTLKTVIIPHISADGDAAGSCSALSEVLQQVGIEWHILTCRACNHRPSSGSRSATIRNLRYSGFFDL